MRNIVFKLKYKQLIINDFRVSRWLIVDVKSVLGFLLHVVLEAVADTSEVDSISVFGVE
jgi:hypothetical protein